MSDGAADEQIPYMAALGMMRIDPARGQTFIYEGLRSPNEMVCRVAMAILCVMKYA